jgi:hypothetical protein
MMWLLLQLDHVAQGLPCGSSAYPLDQRHLSHRVEGGWLILQQSLTLDFTSYLFELFPANILPIDMTVSFLGQ